MAGVLACTSVPRVYSAGLFSPRVYYDSRLLPVNFGVLQVYFGHTSGLLWGRAPTVLRVYSNCTPGVLWVYYEDIRGSVGGRKRHRDGNSDETRGARKEVVES